MVKIVFLSYLHGFGGAEKQNIMLANAMAEQGHDVTLVSICADNPCYPISAAVKYRFLPDRKTNALRIVTRYQDIKKILTELKPDITVNFWYQSAYLTALMPKRITGKVIYSERGDPGDTEYSGVLGLIRKLTLPRIDGFVFQSKGAQRFFNKSVQSRSTVISNPVLLNAATFPDVPERRKAIVTVGRLHPQKNQKLLVGACARIADRLPEYTLEIYGDGALKDKLQQKIDAFGLHGRAFLKGTSSSIHSLIYDASLYVLSSDYEGMPNTLLEAMALGLPCISTDCRPGGARALITDGVNGCIVPIGDEERLAESMLQILSSPRKAQAMGEEAMKIRETHAPDVVYQAWRNFFFSVCTQ